MTADTLPPVRKASIGECAQFFDVSTQAVQDWLRKGMPVLQQGSRGVPYVIDLLAVARWRFQGVGGSDAAVEVDPERLPPADRKAWYEGETKRRDLAIKAGELVPAADVEQVIATAFAALAQDMLSIPDNLERRHGVPPELAEKVEEGIYQAMDALADRMSKLGPVEVPQ